MFEQSSNSGYIDFDSQEDEPYGADSDEQHDDDWDNYEQEDEEIQVDHANPHDLPKRSRWIILIHMTFHAQLA